MENSQSDDTIQFVDSPVRHFANPRADRSDWPARLNQVLDSESIAWARSEIRQWTGYGPTPLHGMESLATSVGVGQVYYKDEAERFGLGSFKALGGAYAVMRVLARETGLGTEDIRSGRYRDKVAGLTVVTATDGNHGRSVAWGARMFGCACRIFIHEAVSEFRAGAMRSLGAQVVRVAGNYDQSVHHATREASRNGWFVVSDTSWEGYTEIPRDVMAGYALMVDEILEQLPPGVIPSHVFVQGGVGGLAASVAARLWMRLGKRRPTLVVVEPDRADCLYRTACNAGPVVINITEETIMAGLSCGEVSILAWSILDAAADHFMTITDDNVPAAMARLATGRWSRQPIVAGESAVAGLCGFLQAVGDATLTDVIGLGAHSCVLLLGTEGATDPEIFLQLTGIDPSMHPTSP